MTREEALSSRTYATSLGTSAGNAVGNMFNQLLNLDVPLEERNKRITRAHQVALGEMRELERLADEALRAFTHAQRSS